MASVRYIVDDIDKAVQFYRDLLGFSVEMHQSGKFASLRREDLFNRSIRRPALVIDIGQRAEFVH